MLRNDNGHVPTSRLRIVKPVLENCLQRDTLRAIGRLAARVAHELNTPLAAVVLNVEAAARTGSNEPRRERQLRRALDSALQAKSIVEALLNGVRRKRQQRARAC